MTNFTHLQSVVTNTLGHRVTTLRVLRGNELHCQIERGAAPALAQLLRAEFQTELVLMVANDRRADLGGLEVHYLFANSRAKTGSCTPPSSCPRLTPSSPGHLLLSGLAL